MAFIGWRFYSISIGMPTSIAALIVTLQPILTNILAVPLLEKKYIKTMGRCFTWIFWSYYSLGNRCR